MKINITRFLLVPTWTKQKTSRILLVHIKIILFIKNVCGIITSQPAQCHPLSDSTSRLYILLNRDELFEGFY